MSREIACCLNAIIDPNSFPLLIVVLMQSNVLLYHCIIIIISSNKEIACFFNLHEEMLI